MSDPLVSACLIVRDEAVSLPRCLRSLRSFADEIVVVDTGSSDETVEIAEAEGAVVFHERWQDDFSLHRNQAVERATGRWILVIDADEEVSETDVTETREKLEDGDLPDILLVSLRLAYPNEQVVTMLAPRLFRRVDHIRYVHPVHEQLDVDDAPALLSNVVIVHHGYEEPESLIEKERRNLRIAELQGDDSAHALHCITRSAFSLNDWRKTIDAAKRLVAGDASPVLKEEGCALGAAASFNSRDLQSLTAFLSAGESLAPDSPDIRLMSLVAEIGRYLHSLRDGDSRRAQFYIRPPIFFHDADAVRTMFAELRSSLSRERREDMGVKNIGGGDGSPWTT